MKKIKKDLSSEVWLYKFLWRYTYNKPIITVPSYYLMDDDKNVIAVMRPRILVLPLLAVVCISLFFCRPIDNNKAIIQIPEFMTVTEDVISLDINNKGEYDIYFEVYERSESGKVVWVNGTIQKESSISNVKVPNLDVKSETVVNLLLRYEVDDSSIVYEEPMIIKVKD